jgi:tyrosine-protein phosphatase YwqE
MQWLNRLLGKSSAQGAESFVNPITTELHSHLIPGIDDGVKTLEESIDVIRSLHHLGFKKIITTPHIMGDFYKNSPSNILPLLDIVRSALKDQQIDIEIHAGAEYMIDDLFMEKIDSGNLLTFGGKYVLIEMPFMEAAPNLKEVLFALNLNGYKPVLAHPERYMYYASQPSKYDELWDAEVLFQLNINSLTGYYSPAALKASEYLIGKKMVSMVGSDCHGMRHLPVLEKAIQTDLYREVSTFPLLNNQL